MKQGAVRKLRRAAALSVFVLATAAGVASPAMAADASDPSNGSGSGSGSGSPSTPENPVTSLVGSIIGGGGSSAH